MHCFTSEMTSIYRSTDSTNPIVAIVSGGGNESTLQINGGNLLPQQQPRRGVWRCPRWLQFFTIEPLTFLYGIASVVAVVYLNEQIKLRICEQELGYNATVCNLVGQSSSSTQHSVVNAINVQLQKRWAMWVLYQHLVSCIPGAIITAFAGAWSDKCGRKPPMILVLIG